MSYEINIKDNGISVRTQQDLFDANGNPVPGQSHRVAIGVGDYTDENGNFFADQFKQAVSSLLTEKFGASFADAIGDRAKLASTEADLQARRDEVLSLMTEVDAKQARITALEDQVAQKETALSNKEAALAAKTQEAEALAQQVSDLTPVGE